MAYGVPNTSSGHNAVGEPHAPRERGRNAVVAVPGKQAPDASDGVAHASRRRTNIQKQQQRNFQAPRHNHQRDKSPEESPEPRKSKPAKQQIPRIGKKLARTLQHMIKPRPNQPRKSRHANNQKSFVVLPSVSGPLASAPFVSSQPLELPPPPVEIRLQHIRRHKQRRSHHQPKGGNRNRPQMQKRNHNLAKRVYTWEARGPS